jgi:hypothetical protein
LIGEYAWAEQFQILDAIVITRREPTIIIADRGLQAEGRGDEVKGDLKQAGEKVSPAGTSSDGLPRRDPCEHFGVNADWSCVRLLGSVVVCR